ncbi:MAG: hypothetical protein ACFFCS_10850 [Candidatus Hodarchaeota archaeon]
MMMMDKTLDNLPVPEKVHAPCGRGSVDVNLLSCLSCEQRDPEKILVLNESKQKIKHSTSSESGEDATVYEVQCSVCNVKYKIGIITVEGETACGSSMLCSTFVMDKNTGGKWYWLGYF